MEEPGRTQKAGESLTSGHMGTVGLGRSSAQRWGGHRRLLLFIDTTVLVSHNLRLGLDHHSLIGTHSTTWLSVCGVLALFWSLRGNCTRQTWVLFLWSPECRRASHQVEGTKGNHNEIENWLVVTLVMTSPWLRMVQVQGLKFTEERGGKAGARCQKAALLPRSVAATPALGFGEEGSLQGSEASCPPVSRLPSLTLPEATCCFQADF